MFTMLSSILLLVASLSSLSRHVVEAHTALLDKLPVHRFQEQARERRRVSDDWIASHHHHSTAAAAFCPCENPSWCRPISRINESLTQVYGFADVESTGALYNWTHISTVAWASDELMCRAHQHGARAVVAAPSFTLTPDLNFTSWVETSLHMVQARHADGIVFDYESPLTRNQARQYVSLISATQNVFSQYNLQVTTCVAWSPDGIDGRNYPYAHLGQVSDYLYVMDYDTQSQIFGACIASANAPYFGMIRGIQRYLQLGIAVQKVILGVPWYGYRYPCLEGARVDDRFCPIPQVPFRGVNCSDAAGREVAYGTILQTFKTAKLKSGMKRDDYMNAVYFNTVDEDGTVYQYWFDDAKSVRAKFAWAKSLGLGGVGPYTLDDLDPFKSPEESEAMWSAFDVFRRLNTQIT